MRSRFSTAARVDQVAAVLVPSGVTTAQIAEAIGISACPRTSQILNAAVAAGVAFRTFARVSADMKTPEMVYFPTEADRDAFRAAYDLDIAKRRKERQSRRSRAKYLRDRSAEIAARSAKRAEARALREAEGIARAVERAALRTAESELRKQRERLAKEAKAAEKQREKAEAKSQRDRLRAETRAAGQLVKLKGTATPKVVKPKGPAHLDGPADASHAKVTLAPRPRERFEVDVVPSCFASLKPGQYLAPAPAWVEAVAA